MRGERVPTPRRAARLLSVVTSSSTIRILWERRIPDSANADHPLKAGLILSHDARLPFQRRLLPEGCSQALRAAREAAGATRREVAAAVGIEPRTLARIERGHQKPLWPTLDRLCDHLGVSVAVLARRWLRDSLDLPQSPVSAPGIGLRALRKAQGMTLVELAAASGVSAATLSRFERGITASRRLAVRVGGPGLDDDDRDVVLENGELAAAFGFTDCAALRAACLAAFAAQTKVTMKGREGRVTDGAGPTG